MKLMKHLLKVSSAFACALGAASAGAAQYTVYGSSNGTFHQVVSTLFVTATTSFVCTWDSLVNVTNGVARSTTVELTGTAICPQSSACPGSLPWVWAAPTSDAGPNNVAIPVCIVIPAPVYTTCSGTLYGTLTNTGQFSFTANLGPHCTWKSAMPSPPTPLDAIYP